MASVSTELAQLLARTREALLAELDRTIVRPAVPTVLAPLPEAPAPAEVRRKKEITRPLWRVSDWLSHVCLPQDEQEPVAAEEPVDTCGMCGGVDSVPTNALLLCDGVGCGRAFHMLCLPRPLAEVPEGEWRCHVCVPPKQKFCAADERTMPLAVGTRLWASDHKSRWAKGRVLKVRQSEAPQEEAPKSGRKKGKLKDGPRLTRDGEEDSPSQGTSTASATPTSTAAAAAGSGEGGESNGCAAVRINFTGFGSKHDEWIEVGAGRLRPLEEGPPLSDDVDPNDETRLFVMDEILEHRQRNGRLEMKVSWEGFPNATWEPRSCFVGTDARRKLDAYLAEKKQREQQAAGADSHAVDSTANGAGAGGEEEEEEEEAAGGFASHVGVRSMGGRGTKRGYKCAPTPPQVSLPYVTPLPESRSWVHVSSNHAVADAPITFVPWLGDAETDREQMREVESGAVHAPNPALPVSSEAGGGSGGSSEGGGDGDGAGGGGVADEAAASAGSSGVSAVAPHSASSVLQPLPKGRSSLSSLFCRRCFTYECTIHPIAQPRPRWCFAPTKYPQRPPSSGGAACTDSGCLQAPAKPNAKPPGAKASAAKRGRPGSAAGKSAGDGSVFAPLADFLQAANASDAPPLDRVDALAGEGATVMVDALCTCILAPSKDMLFFDGDGDGDGDGEVESGGGDGGRGGGGAKREFHGKPMTSEQLRRKETSHVQRYGTGCCHDGPCDTSSPDCVCIATHNYCEVHCACGPACKNRFPGCHCKRECTTKVCPCYAIGRECDPDLCGCAAKEYADVRCDACMPEKALHAHAAAPAKPKGGRPRKRGSLHTHVKGKQKCATGGGGGEGEYLCGKEGEEEEGEEEEGEGEGEEAAMVSEDAALATVPSATTTASAILSNSSSNSGPPPPRRCRNMSIQLREQVPLLIGPSRVAGWGAFAPRALERGTFLLEYRGELISQNEADRRGLTDYDRRHSSYLFNLNDVQVVDACRKGNRARFLNNSETNANAATKILSTRGDHHIGIFAQRPVERGEEIFFNYRYDSDLRQLYGFKQGRRSNKRRSEVEQAPNDGGGQRAAGSTEEEEKAPGKRLKQE